MFSSLSNSGEDINCAYPVIKETIPKSSLGYNTNNKYPEFPPLMSDGRSVVASWQQNTVVNKNIVESNNLKTNWQYRQYLTHNANEILKQNFTEASNDVGYFKRYIEPPIISVQSDLPKQPYVYKSNMDQRTSLGSQDSDLKQLYLSREQLNSRKISPAITQEELMRNKK